MKKHNVNYEKMYWELRDKAIDNEREIEQILGKALGYPRYCDDPKNFPGATEADGVCVGVEVAVTLALQAADRIAALERLVAQNGAK
jgi:hypothetical protein